MCKYQKRDEVGPCSVLCCLYLFCNALNEPSVTVPSGRFVILKRVSTQKHGADGLGISAQQREIELFLQQRPDAKVVREFIELESGGKELHERPVLQEAIELCKRTNSSILVAKLSRLSCDAAFVRTLMRTAASSSALLPCHQQTTSNWGSTHC